ncbi:MAG: hypothetical protein A2001_01410 [Treponema sp. GWC1_61_84]|nr:MAG: hypothetical protein A2001_01410 [Treponema sp. GWC1_61_84]
MAYQVEVDFGAGWVDISAYLDGRLPVRRTRAIHRDLKPVVNTARFSIVNNVSLVNQFQAATGDVPVRIHKSGVDYFTGLIRPSHKLRVGLMFPEPFEIECVDGWYSLERTFVGDPFIMRACAVSNPANKAASILHQLFYRAGFLDASLNLSAITTTIAAYSVDTTTGSAPTYRAVIEKLLGEFGYSVRLDASGIVWLYDLGPAAIVPTGAFEAGAGGNIANEYTVEHSELRAEAVDVTYYPPKTLADQVVFEDTTGGDETNIAAIVIPPGGYYPEGADATHDVIAAYKLEDYEIIDVQGAALEVTTSSGSVATQVATFEATRARLRLYSAGGCTISKLRIKGDVTAKADKAKSIFENVTNSTKRESIELANLGDSASADRLAILRADWHRVGCYGYAFDCSDLSVEPGEYWTFVEASIMGITTTVRVLTVNDGDDEKCVKVTVEAVTPFATAPIIRESETGTRQGTESSKDAALAARTRIIDVLSTPGAYDGETAFYFPAGGKSIQVVTWNAGTALWNVEDEDTLTDAVASISASATRERVLIQWTAVAEALHYILEKSTNSGSTWLSTGGWPMEASTNEVQEILAAGVNSADLSVWRYRVRAYNQYGVASVTYSPVASVSIPAGWTYTPVAPTTSFGAAKRTLRATITPQASLANADGWDIQISRDNANWYSPNPAAKADADGWYTGALNGYLTVKENAFVLQYLPIPLDANSLPLAAGQNYYLRARARCSSPATQSGWTASAVMTVYPVLGTDLVTSTVTNAILAADSVAYDKIIDGAVRVNKLSVLAQNYVNNPTFTGNIRGWGNILEDGSGTAVAASYNGTETALAITSALNHGVRSIGFAVDHSKIYRVELQVKKSAVTGQIYVGIAASPNAIAGYDGTGYAAGDSNINPLVDGASRSWGTPTANWYAYICTSGASPTTYTTITFYVAGALRGVNDIPKVVSPASCCGLVSTAKYFAVRVLNWSNSVSTVVYVKNISVSEVGAGTLVAQNIYTTSLSAITANLGTITAGSLRSYDYSAGVDGFIVDLDNGKITQGAGVHGGATTGFYLDSDGNFSLKNVLTFTASTSTLSLTGIFKLSGTGYFESSDGKIRIMPDADGPDDGFVLGSRSYSSAPQNGDSRFSIGFTGVGSYTMGQLLYRTYNSTAENWTANAYALTEGWTDPTTAIIVSKAIYGSYYAGVSSAVSTTPYSVFTVRDWSNGYSSAGVYAEASTYTPSMRPSSNGSVRLGTSSIRWGGAYLTTIDAAGHVYPSANSTYTCGTSSLRWSNTYTVLLNASGLATMAAISAAGDVYPSTDSTRSLGTSSLRWANGHFDALTLLDGGRLNQLSSWTSFTMSITATVTSPSKGGGVVERGYYRREGDCLHIIWKYKQTSAGSSGAGSYYFNVPGGYSINTSISGMLSPTALGASVILDFDLSHVVGRGQAHLPNINQTILSVHVYDSTKLYMTGIATSTNTISAATYALGNSALEYYMDCLLPISGW